jgi:uncharacterized protein (TIGR03437 family)
VAENFAGDPKFVSAAAFDYRLQAGSPAIDVGRALGNASGFALTPERHYVHTACALGRVSRGVPDAGAFEFNGDQTISVGLPRCEIPVPPPPGPSPRLVNGANFQVDYHAPGSIASLFAGEITDVTIQPTATPLPTSLNGVSVTVNLLPAPLFFISPGQVNIQIPFETEPGDATVILRNRSRTFTPARIRVLPASPAIFLYAGTDRAIAQNQDFTLNEPGKGAIPGSVVVVYMTGGGQVSSVTPTGQVTRTLPLAEAVLPSSATIGGKETKIYFLGMTPGLVAVLQANLEVPDLPPGQHEAVITINGVDSNPGKITVSGP